jgi:hypothetical protein
MQSLTEEPGKTLEHSPQQHAARIFLPPKGRRANRWGQLPEGNYVGVAGCSGLPMFAQIGADLVLLRRLFLLRFASISLHLLKSICLVQLIWLVG